MAARTTIGYDTNSKDIDKMKARVFVGGLQANVTRDQVIELFASYGHITGATLFKGYAFVQYSNSTEADLATMALNGYVWNKNRLEVKVAYDPSKASDLMPTKRPKREETAPAAKRVKVEKQEPSITPQTTYEPAHQSTNVILPIGGDVSPDFFICSGCHFKTNYLETFVGHRLIPCSTKTIKPEGEPEIFRCFTCSETFPTSWKLLHHLRKAHEITMYKSATA